VSDPRLLYSRERDTPVDLGLHFKFKGKDVASGKRKANEERKEGGGEKFNSRLVALGDMMKKLRTSRLSNEKKGTKRRPGSGSEPEHEEGKEVTAEPRAVNLELRKISGLKKSRDRGIKRGGLSITLEETVLLGETRMCEPG